MHSQSMKRNKTRVLINKMKWNQIRNSALEQFSVRWQKVERNTLETIKIRFGKLHRKRTSHHLVFNSSNTKALGVVNLSRYNAKINTVPIKFKLLRKLRKSGIPHLRSEKGSLVKLKSQSLLRIFKIKQHPNGNQILKHSLMHKQRSPMKIITSEEKFKTNNHSLTRTKMITRIMVMQQLKLSLSKQNKRLAGLNTIHL